MFNWIINDFIGGLLSSQKIKIALGTFIMGVLTKVAAYLAVKWGLVLTIDPAFVNHLVDVIFALGGTAIAGHTVQTTFGPPPAAPDDVPAVVTTTK